MIIFTAAYAAAHYTLTYCVVLLTFNNINYFLAYFTWSDEDRREATYYLRLNAFLSCLSFVGISMMRRLLKILIEIARSTEENMQSFERKNHIMVNF